MKVARRALGGRYTYNEQRESVQRQRHGVEGESIQPAFGILDSTQHIAPCESLVVSTITVCRQASVNDRSFGLGQEACGVWVIVNEEICPSGDNNRGKSFLNGTATLETGDIFI